MHSDEGKSPELERVEPPVPNEASQTLVLATYHLLCLSCLTQINNRGRILHLPLGDRSFGERQASFGLIPILNWCLSPASPRFD